MLPRRLLRVKSMQALYGWVLAPEAYLHPQEECVSLAFSLLKEFYEQYLTCLVYVCWFFEEIGREADRTGAHLYWTEEQRKALRLTSKNPIVERLRHHSRLFELSRERGLLGVLPRDVALACFRDAENSYILHDILLQVSLTKKHDEARFWYEPTRRLWEEHLLKHRVFRALMGDLFFAWEDEEPFLSFSVNRTLELAAVDGISEPVYAYGGAKWRGQMQFVERLIVDTINNFSNVSSIIAQKAKNWALNRIGTAERTLLHMCTTEWLCIGDSPAVAVLNDYVEIAKQFATYEQSYAFVNGILDAVMKELVKEGRIVQVT